MIRVKNLSKAYGETSAVEDLTFDVESGEILGLVGPNGAGKTTTLRALTGILPPSGGLLEIEGHDVVRQPMKAKSCMALIPDEPNLFESLTVWEHLEFTARVFRVDGWEGRAERLLEELEMTGNREKMGDELSRGMRQKVAIACALLHEPRALLLDEPLTGLDPRGIRTLFDAVKKRADEGTAVILSSHLLGQIENLCTRFLIISQGVSLFSGSKEDMRLRLPSLGKDASLEEIFFEVTEGQEPGETAGQAPG